MDVPVIAASPCSEVRSIAAALPARRRSWRQINVDRSRTWNNTGNCITRPRVYTTKRTKQRAGRWKQDGGYLYGASIPVKVTLGFVPVHNCEKFKSVNVTTLTGQ